MSRRKGRQVELILVMGALCRAPSAPICPLDTVLGPSQQHEKPQNCPGCAEGTGLRREPGQECSPH